MPRFRLANKWANLRALRRIREGAVDLDYASEAIFIFALIIVRTCIISGSHGRSINAEQNSSKDIGSVKFQSVGPRFESSCTYL